MKGIEFENKYLKKIILKIEYSEIIKLSGYNKEKAEDFRRYIFNTFPNINFEINNITLTNDIEFPTQKIIETGNFNWIFSNENKTKFITLNSEYLILEYKKEANKNFDNLLKDINLILDALNQYYPYKYQNISLRYINQINEDEINENNITNYINPSLTNNIISTLENDEKLLQILTKIDIEKENHIITLQYGFFNPKFPDSNFEKEYILDFECNIKDISQIQSNDKIINELEKMNKLILNKFDYATLDKLKKLMR